MYRLKTADEKKRFENFIEALFSLECVEDVNSRLYDLKVPKPFRLRIKVLYSKKPVNLVFDNLVENGMLKYLKRETRTYIFEREIGRAIPKKIRVPFYNVSFSENIDSENIQAIIAICRAEEWNALRRLSSSIYPKLVPILLSQADLIKSAKRLRLMTGHDVKVKSLSAKETSNQLNHTFRKTLRVWSDEELDQALLSIQERGQIINSIELDFFDKIGNYPHVLPTTTCKIRKNGEIEITGGFKLAFDAIAVHIAKVGKKKLEFFSKRGLRVSNYEPKPLAVNFSTPIFNKLEKVREFVNSLKKYPHSMHAVLHGNPYAHVKITDNFDGSSFDVWATSSSRIALMPGLKATEAAFERLIHYIFDEFKEGTIANYDREGRAIEDTA